ncbi:MAG: UDP-N-acetylmuramoyl-L-alanine--D-glutamate ligase [Clostridia bacterium]|nr:UDP-N-acetylmuramoyl-L-alanine--D-glutamate ligase [Clostridia bacterium]
MYNNDKMNDFNGKKVALLGMGKSNMAAMRFFIEHGAIVEGRDIKKPSDEVINTMNSFGVKLVFGDKWLEDINCDIAVRSPGIRPDVVKNQIGKAILTSEMEVFCSNCKGHIIAITGSDGKTTTTTVISKMLEKQFENSNVKVWLGGNIGIPLIEHIDDVSVNDYVVLELSSFQLMTMRFSPSVAVITNITPNHLNWHVSMEEYVEAKKNIYLNQHKGCKLVLNADNDITSSICNTNAKYFSCEKSKSEAYFDGTSIKLYGKDIISKTEIKIPGKHNAQNYMAAMLALDGIVDVENMCAVAKRFGGVRHRIELVEEKNGIKYVNSSIDTSPTRTIAALSCYDKKLISIVGGYDKHLDMTPLVEPIKEKVHTLVCTGDTGESIMNMMLKANFDGDIKYIKSFDEAVKYACDKAVSGDIVLLTPACASFDAFINFEQRGDRFCELVKQIISEQITN